GVTGWTGAIGMLGRPPRSTCTPATAPLRSIGATGATGATGAKGATGVDGVTGWTGAIGPQGNPGADGSVGATGPKGATGADGVTGPRGPNGLPGGPGATGATGATGAVGPSIPLECILRAGDPTQFIINGVNGPANPGEIGGDNKAFRARVDLTNATQARVMVTITATSQFPGSFARGEYSTDGLTWTSLSGANDSPTAPLDQIGVAKSPWISLTTGARNDVMLRMAYFGGNGQTVTITLMSVQFK
ncbi:MAG: hypothetical protein JST22_15355, partial [Bacteroidetes bacterium]|nr:hypothetical protein [Bacteroidota bacterium]